MAKSAFALNAGYWLHKWAVALDVGSHGEAQISLVVVIFWGAMWYANHRMESHHEKN